ECTVLKTHEILEVLKNITCGKARGPDGIAGEQIKYGGTLLWEWVIKLMKSVFLHGVALNSTLESWIMPLVKDRKRNTEDSDNYRGIAISNIWAKIVDRLMLIKINEKVKLNECQFGFKKKLSTKMAVQVIIEMGKRYCKRGGSLFCGFVDIKKAFDKLEYKEIWARLNKLNIGRNIKHIIKAQY